MAADKGMLRQFFYYLIQLAVTLQCVSVRLMEQNELVPAFDIQDIAAVYTVNGRFIAETDFGAAFPSGLVNCPFEYRIESFRVERF